MPSADVAVVGAGIIGLSIAYHLVLRRPDLHVVVLERQLVAGGGATSKCTGGIRHQFGTEVNVRLTQLSYPEFLSFEQEHKQPIGLRTHGYLFVAASGPSWQALQANVAVQVGLGVPTRLVEPSEMRDLFPGLHTDDLQGGAFCALDASATPSDVLQGYLSSARARGVEVVYEAPVSAIETRGGRVCGVRAGDTEFAAEVVVDAAGPYVADVAALAHVTVPARPFRRQVFVMAADPSPPLGLPMLVDLDTGWYVHQEANGQLLFGGTDKDVRPGTEEIVDWDGFERVGAAALARVPGLAENVHVVRAYAGVRTLTFDHHAILGRVPEVPGFFIATACNGHGFMHAPAVGLLLAEEILDGQAHSLDLAPLRLDRFAHGSEADEPIMF